MRKGDMMSPFLRLLNGSVIYSEVIRHPVRGETANYFPDEYVPSGQL
ncbi:hypothetical protein CH54_2017 [Yersinia rochesterensis]|uniref:Uncharacterized protein n=1 Tax=Yersinia rochesterensis TaxID=1604335 RepID=A0ABM5SMF5_9GAMM|nr:hypothetical protein CH54_2017 [Yersinia rochesterensis]